MVANFSIFDENINLKIQEAQYSLIWVNKKKLIPLQMVTAAMELKDIYSLERKL